MKVALLTGSAGFLGRAVAEALAEKGYTLVLHYHRKRPDIRVFQKKNTRVFLKKGDFRKTMRFSGWLREALRPFQRLDLLVNSASLFEPQPKRENDLFWREMFQVNAAAPYRLAKAAAPYLEKTHGAVVNLTDVYARRPAELSNHAAYVASKAALEALTKILARELAPKVRVNAVAPGAIRVDFLTPKARQALLRKTLLRRFGEPRDVARAVLFFAEEPFLTGQTLFVDGGRLSAF